MPTIGISIPVPDPWGAAIQDRRCGYGEPEAAGIPTHVTILPPSEVAEADLPAVREHLGRAAAGVSPFTILLSGTGSFRPVSPVVFVQVAEGVAGCEQLERAIRTGPLARELSFPFHPHVTVAHGCQEEAMDRAFAELRTFECEFPVRGVCLYLHEADEWREVECFPLGGTGQAAAEPSTLE